jgi:hypothetical protein
MAQVINTTTTDYLEKASAANDSEVKAWMKSSDLHLIPDKIGTSTVCQENGVSLSRKPIYLSLVQHNEPERDIMINHIGQRNLSKTDLGGPCTVGTYDANNSRLRYYVNLLC